MTSTGIGARVARKEHDLLVTAGHRCAVSADLDRFIRLSFSFYEPAELDDAVQRLAAAIEATPIQG